MNTTAIYNQIFHMKSAYSEIGQAKMKTAYSEYLNNRKRAISSYPEEREDLTLLELKRLKVSDEPSLENEQTTQRDEQLTNPCQALIPVTMKPDEAAFRMTIVADFPESHLARLICEQQNTDHEAENNMLDKEVSSKPGKELVLYQPPLSELLKEAAYLDEHQMQLD